jgi:hypothetical protein
MVASHAKPPPIAHTLTLDLQIPAHFVTDMIRGLDIFTSGQSAYWASGVRCADGSGYLVYDHARDGMPTDIAIARAVRCHETNKPLPDGWHLINREVAIRAWCEGVKRWGVDWYEKVDGPRRDVVLQLGLLGELRYG